MKENIEKQCWSRWRKASFICSIQMVSHTTALCTALWSAWAAL